MPDRPSPPFHWPGGIPPEVKADPNGDITLEQANEAAKGCIPTLYEANVEAPRDEDDPESSGGSGTCLGY
ncbi:hypothetical protein N7495_007434 [Penicillium taxi]|uniref:uncharacterized protein n=1 Tax=Penicillium taxi TaxID=168475 RepID=UPI0025455BE1|nr:uncharacterized protein N7495_007434 [Penicillium taxi]KAJ5887393.1 hypothetical protein N7495_007434 [Penicillium taxi]